MKACILRLYSVYGPRERPDKLYTKLIFCGLNDEVFKIFDVSENHFRSFTYVGDIVEGIYLAVMKQDKLNGEVVTLGAVEQYQTLEGMALVEELRGKKIKFEVVPKRRGDQVATSAEINKAMDLLDYNPSTSLGVGLEKQIEWFKKFRMRK